MACRPGIYLILNVSDGKAYVGSSRDAVRRLYIHRRMLRRGEHHSPHLQRAFDKFGEAAFSFRIIERCNEDRLLRREQIWMNMLQTSDSDFGYNVCPVAGTRRGVPQPMSVSTKMRALHSGRPKSAEHRARISASRKGQIKSSVHIEKLRRAATVQMADPVRRQQASEYGKVAKRFTNIGNG